MRSLFPKPSSLLAALLGIPATVAVVRAPSVLLPGMFVADTGTSAFLVLLEAPHLVILGALVLYSLCQYWLLAIRTVRGLVHPFRRSFWVGLAAALLYGVLEIARAQPLPVSLILIWGTTLYFVAEQLRLRAAPRSTSAYITAALATYRPNYPALGLGILLCISVGFCSRPRDTQVLVRITLDDTVGKSSRERATAEMLDEQERVIFRIQENGLHQIFLATTNSPYYLGAPPPTAVLRARFLRIDAPGCRVAVVPIDFTTGYRLPTCQLTDLEGIVCPDAMMVVRFERRVRLHCD